MGVGAGFGSDLNRADVIHFDIYIYMYIYVYIYIYIYI